MEKLRNMREGNIGLFDSGVGGVSVLKMFLEVLPNENYIYFGDNANAPYSEKSSKDIEKFCFKIANFLIENECKIIVIACNTATASAFKAMKNIFDIPIIEVVSNGAKAAVNATKNGNIVVFATEFTVNSNVYPDEIMKLDSNVNIYQASGKLICPMIESGWENYSDRLDILKSYISDIPVSADTLVLGCTHYPFIIDDIKTFFKKNIVDPSYQTVLEAKDIIERNYIFKGNGSGFVRFYTSGDIVMFKNIVEKFLNKKIDNIEHISL